MRTQMTAIVLCISIVMLVVIYKLRFWCMYLLGRRYHHGIHDLVGQMTHTKITRRRVPRHLRDRLLIFNLYEHHPDVDSTATLPAIMDTIRNHRHPRFPTDNCYVIDYLTAKAPYAFSAHTDTEWNTLSNDGYQVWYLVSNKNPDNLGNMFILDNPYLFDKYSNNNIFYTLAKENDDIVVSVNRPPLLPRPGCRRELERMSVENFLATTTVYYLDFQPGDCLVFDRGLCHMSDTRDRQRYAVNFRVLLGQPKKRDQDCGFLANNGIAYRT